MNRSVEDQISELGYSTESKKGIMQTCLERKKIGWQVLKGWDENTKHNLQVSKNFIEELFDRLGSVLSQSFKRYDCVYKFFEGFLINIKTQIVLKEKMSLFRMDTSKPFNLESGIRGSDLKKNEPLLHAMVEFNREYELFKKNLQLSLNKIKEEINLKILTHQVKPYEKNIKSLYSNIASMKKILIKRSNQTIKKLKRFRKAFDESILDHKRGKRTKVNSFDYACKFVGSVKSIDMAITDFGMLLISIWEQCNILEEKRVSALRQSFMKYSDIMNEIFGSEAQKAFQNRYL